MTDYPCLPLVQTLKHASPQFGGPVRVTAAPAPTAPFLSAVPYPTKGRIKAGRTFTTVAGRAWLGIYEHPVGADSLLPFLVFSFYATHDESSCERHDAVMSALEPRGRMVWTGTTPFLLVWGARGVFVRAEAVLSKRNMREFADVYGDLSAEGNWLGARLLPRRWPGSLRVVTDTHVQLWIALFTLEDSHVD